MLVPVVLLVDELLVLVVLVVLLVLVVLGRACEGAAGNGVAAAVGRGVAQASTHACPAGEGAMRPA